MKENKEKLQFARQQLKKLRAEWLKIFLPIFLFSATCLVGGTMLLMKPQAYAFRHNMKRMFMTKTDVIICSICAIVLGIGLAVLAKYLNTQICRSIRAEKENIKKYSQ